MSTLICRQRKRYLVAPHGSGGRGVRAASLLLLALVVSCCVLVPRQAEAWKPKQHIHTGNEAIAEILGGQDQVTIDGRAYEVPSEIAQAIRNYPDYYRAGCIGPDGFPDLAFGQIIIHPDWKDDGGTYTHEWLKLIYEKGWAYYQAHGGNAQGQQALAFTYGFLTHAGGDLWGHTLINSFAGGAWPDIPDGDLRIAIRHIIVEEYISQHVPATQLSMAVPEDFIYQVFIASPESFQMSHESSLTSAFGIPYFLDLRARLVSLRNSLDCDWYNPLDWINCGKIAYIDAWIDDIDAGLHAWPHRMAEINRHLFVDESAGSMDAALADIEQFAYDHLLSMYGAPDFVGGFLDLWDGLTTWVENLIGFDIPSVGDLIVYIFESVYGVDFDELKDYFTHPANYINTAPLFASDTSARLDALMHPSGGAFDQEQFAANWNTIILAKMILLGPEQMNQILADHDVGPLYGNANDAVPVGMRENAMLGFIRTLDGDHQWRRTPMDDPTHQHSEGMPLWIDCQARQLVFRPLFTDWEQHVPPGNFPDAGDPCECWNDLPPTISVVFNRDVLWPPNHKLASITAEVTVEDDCDPAPTFALLSIVSNEPDNGGADGNTVHDIQGADIGTADVHYQLRSERAGNGEGRVYTITYMAMDNAGNADTCDFYIQVPHDASGFAKAAGGFTADGRGFAERGRSFMLVIPSATAVQGPPLSGIVAIDPTRTFVGNERTQVAVDAVRSMDVTGDSVDDLVLVFPAVAGLSLSGPHDRDGGSLGLRYEDYAGAGFLVPDIFALGAPLAVQASPLQSGDLAKPKSDTLPAVTALVGIRPNPFNPTTTVSFDLAAAGPARIDVYDLRGMWVRTLADGVLGAGRHESTWDGRNDRGDRVSTGVYFIRLATAGVTQTMKAILIK